MPWKINVPGLEWITKAFKLRSGEAPSAMLEEVSPVLDILQNGIALSRRDSFSVDHSSPGPGNTSYDLFETGDEWALIRMHVRKTGAATATFALALGINPVGTAGQQIWLIRNDSYPGAAGYLAFVALAGGAPFLYLPPRATFRAILGPMTAPDTVEIRAQVILVPGGCKPW